MTWFRGEGGFVCCDLVPGDGWGGGGGEVL